MGAEDLGGSASPIGDCSGTLDPITTCRSHPMRLSANLISPSRIFEIRASHGVGMISNTDPSSRTSASAMASPVNGSPTTWQLAANRDRTSACTFKTSCSGHASPDRMRACSPAAQSQNRRSRSIENPSKPVLRQFGHLLRTLRTSVSSGRPTASSVSLDWMSNRVPLSLQSSGFGAVAPLPGSVSAECSANSLCRLRSSSAASANRALSADNVLGSTIHRWNETRTCFQVLGGCVQRSAYPRRNSLNSSVVAPISARPHAISLPGKWPEGSMMRMAATKPLRHRTTSSWRLLIDEVSSSVLESSVSPIGRYVDEDFTFSKSLLHNSCAVCCTTPDACDCTSPAETCTSRLS